MGLVAGLSLIGLIFFLVLHFGHLHREPNHATTLPLALFWSAALIPNALHEELGFRSYTLRRLQDRFGMWTAQLGVAFVFALYHFIGGMNLITVLLSTALWSVIYGMATVLSRGIAFAVGLSIPVEILAKRSSGLNLDSRHFGQLFLIVDQYPLTYRSLRSAPRLSFF